MSYNGQLVLPTDLQSYGGTGGPGFMTEVVRTPNGYEYRDVLRGYELQRYTVSFAAMLESAGGKLLASYLDMYAFFRAAQGRRYSFRAKDPLDYTVSVAEGKFIATAVSNKWQCVKRYTVGSATQDRIITKLGGTYSASAGTIDPDTGLCTNATLPASWSTTLYYVQVRFDDDTMLPRWFTSSGGRPVLGWEDITLVEVNES